MPANEGEQFDIRATVEEFKHAVSLYTQWKPGMAIQVSHIKRRNIPLFVFPGGVRPSRPPRGEVHRGSRARPSQSSKPGETSIGNGDKSVDMADASSRRHQFDAVASGGPSVSGCIQETNCSETKPIDHFDSKGTMDVNSESRKRKHVEDATTCNSSAAKGPISHSVKSPETSSTIASGTAVAEGTTNATVCAKEAEALAIKNLTSHSPPKITALPEELEVYELQGKARDIGVAVNGCGVESSTTMDVMMQTGSSTSNHISNGVMEELEVLDFNLLIIIALKFALILSRGPFSCTRFRC